MSKSEQVIQYRRKRKLDLIRLKGGKCCICGFNAFPEALEFHHVDPAEKLYQLGSGNCHALENDLKEVRKTALICSNCHKGVHANLLSLPDDWTFIDEEVERELRASLLPKQKVCANCGKPIDKGATLCWDCHVLSRQNPNMPSRDELKDLVRTTPFTKIGEMFDVSDNTIRKWCKKMDLPYRVNDIKQYSDEEWALV